VHGPAKRRPFSFLTFLLKTAVDTYFEYLRTYSQELGSRIVEMYPPVQGPNDPIAKQVATSLREPPRWQAILSLLALTPVIDNPVR
jgi:hypothetical protein